MQIVAKLPTPFLNPTPKQQIDNNYVFKPERYAFKITSPTNNPWGKVWTVTIKVDFNKRDPAKKWPNLVRITLTPPTRILTGTLEWVNDSGPLFYYHVKRDLDPRLEVSNFFTFPGLNPNKTCSGWISLIVFKIKDEHLSS